MKSRFSLIFILVIVVVIGVLAYFFVFKKSGTDTEPGLVSATTGAAQGIQPSTSAASETGSQVVSILRNLSVIKLDDAVFRNPSFALLSDISIILPPVANQGRRNPFAAIGVEVAPVSSTPPANTGGPTF